MHPKVLWNNWRDALGFRRLADGTGIVAPIRESIFGSGPSAAIRGRASANQRSVLRLRSCGDESLSRSHLANA